jgi:hypothetical protein
MLVVVEVAVVLQLLLCASTLFPGICLWLLS